MCVFLFECSGDHRDLHVLTHSFPTRRSSDLGSLVCGLAVVEGGHDADLIWTAAEIDEAWEVEQWGEDKEAAARSARRRHEFAMARAFRSEEHTSELQSLMRLSYAVFCLTKKTTYRTPDHSMNITTQHAKRLDLPSTNKTTHTQPD